MYWLLLIEIYLKHLCFLKIYKSTDENVLGLLDTAERMLLGLYPEVLVSQFLVVVVQ